MVRVWGGGIASYSLPIVCSDSNNVTFFQFFAERPDFYATCDVLGLLVYQEFWMTGKVLLRLFIGLF